VKGVDAIKIALNINGKDPTSSKAAEARSLERVILNAKKGDWEAKELLIQNFRPLMTSLVGKRTKDTALTNNYMEVAKAGLLTAANKYTTAIGVDNFRLFALEYIEKNMDHLERRGSFFSRLFGFWKK